MHNGVNLRIKMIGANDVADNPKLKSMLGLDVNIEHL